MDQEVVPHRTHKAAPDEERMLFVRTDSIIESMVRAPLLVAGLIVVVVTMPIQPSLGSTRNLDMMIYADGSTHVSAEIGVDPLATDYGLDLYGSDIDNFVAVGEHGFLLQADIREDTAMVETFGSSLIAVEYDIHNLVSKTGRLWTFSLDSPADFTLLLPKNSVIVGMTNLPINMRIIDDQTQLTMPAGHTEIDYMFSSAPPMTPDPPDHTAPSLDDPQSDYAVYGISGGVAVAAAAIAAAVMLYRRRQKTPPPLGQTGGAAEATAAKPAPATGSLTHAGTDVEEILKAVPDIRDDDKKIVRFISSNGGEVLESELRKKFLQPRTTMWRAVKRLERNGLVEIEKRGPQNLVKLRQDVGQGEDG